VKLDGLVALVTDGGSRLGAEICDRLTAAGAIAVPTDCDLRTSAEADRVVADVVAQHGRIDGVVTLDSALLVEGVDAGRGVRDPEPSDKEWSERYAASVDAAYFPIRAALRDMVPRGSGSIVVLTSIAGVCGEAGAVERSAAAAALLGMTRSLARELAASGVRINAVAATSIEPDAVSTAGPAGRPVEPAEIAAVTVFLLGPDASYISGETVNVNGARLNV
jgi:3-oxoacyl-[acyl-carrier protein] reductase